MNSLLSRKLCFITEILFFLDIFIPSLYHNLIVIVAPTRIRVLGSSMFSWLYQCLCLCLAYSMMEETRTILTRLGEGGLGCDVTPFSFYVFPLNFLIFSSQSAWCLAEWFYSMPYGLWLFCSHKDRLMLVSVKVHFNLSL